LLVAEELRTCADGGESGRARAVAGAKRRQTCRRGRGPVGVEERPRAQRREMPERERNRRRRRRMREKATAADAGEGGAMRTGECGLRTAGAAGTREMDRVGV
jgi:hypothetical protein